MWNDRAGAAEVNAELKDCGKTTDVVETDSVETGDVEDTGPGRLEAEAAMEDFAE